MKFAKITAQMNLARKAGLNKSETGFTDKEIDLQPEYKTKDKTSKRSLHLDANIGVYRIISFDLQTAYIGQSVNIPSRLRQHKHALKTGAYSFKGDKLKSLQDDYNRFGCDIFKFEQIHECVPEELLEWETYYCKLYTSEGYRMYNHFINTEVVGLMCPDTFKPIIEKMIKMLDSGKLQTEQLEQALWTIESQ